MKTVHWLFAISSALFIFGIGFIIAGARANLRAEPVREPEVAIESVATVKQIMRGIVSPAANVVFEAVSTTVSAAGIEENQPRTDEEWDNVGANAAALIESANMLVTGNRAIDKQQWAAMAQALADAGKTVLKATSAKDAEGVLAAGEVLNESCDGCHRQYMRQ